MVITNNRLLDLLTGRKKKIRKRSILSLAVVLLLLLSTLPGCGMLGIGQSKQGQQGGQGQQEKQEEKVPKPLTQLEAGIEKVFQTLGGPAIQMADEGEEQSKDQSQKKEQQNGQNQSKGKEQKEQQGDQQKQGQNQDKQQGQDQSKQQDQGGKQEEGKEGKEGKEETTAQPDPWQQVTMQITELHTQWNDSMPEITKQGAKSELIDNFSKSLNDLTRIAAEKDKMKTMLAASGLYSSIPDLYALYKSPNNPIIKEIIYYTRDAILNASIGQWDKSTADLEKLKSAWGYFKNSLDKGKQAEAAKTDLSITELEKVIKDKDAKLTDLKGRLVLSNLESMEKSQKEDKQQK